MIGKEICEALYASHKDVVVPRRRSILKPAMVALLGMVLLIINMMVVTDDSGAVGMALLVTGVALLGYGIIVVAMRYISNELVPYHLPTKRYMCFTERYYYNAQLAELSSAVASGNQSAIDAIATSNVSAITLIECRSTDNSMVAYAIYEYANFENRIVGEVKIIS